LLKCVNRNHSVCHRTKCPLYADRVRKSVIIRIWETKSHPWDS